MLVGDHENFFDHNFISGTTSLEIPTMLISAELEVDLDDPLAFELISISNGASKRNLRQGQAIERSLIADYHGFFKTLVVRVGDKRGHSPTYTASELSDHIFIGDLTMVSFIFIAHPQMCRRIMIWQCPYPLEIYFLTG